MVESEVTIREGPSGVFETVDSAESPTIDDSELHNKWRKLVTTTRGNSYSFDYEERDGTDAFRRAIELAISHPDSFSITTNPVSRETDMRRHVRDHFSDLFNENDNAPRYKGPRPHVDKLLKACELAYLYDAVHRFVRETVVHPEIDGLETLRFVEVLPEAAEWMGEVNTVWRVLARDLESERPLGEMIERLYAERDEFVETAKANNVFHPVRGDYLDDPTSVPEDVKRRLSRGADVSPELVHDYCFTLTVDRY